MTKNAIGLVLIDAPHSALNNAGADVSERTENKIAVKVIRRGRDSYPYVSSQAWRRWWRDTLQEKFGWPMSPITREKKIAFTSANPFIYPDDDVFGYMRAQGASEGGTLTRLSPLKNSPLVSVTPQQIVDDFGSMTRQEDNPVLHEHQFYSTILKGIFALELSAVGVFQSSARTGFKNLDEAYIKKPIMQEAIKSSNATERENNRLSQKGKDWVLPQPERAKRAKETLAALPFLSGGAKQALHHTDVTPKFVMLAVIAGGNNLFMNIATQDEKKLINTTALKQVIVDYADVILSDIFIGRLEGFQDSLQADLEALQAELAGTKRIHLHSPKRAVEEFAGKLEDYMNS